MIWRNGWIEEQTLTGMDASEKWMIIRFTPYQTTTLQKWMCFQKLFFKSSLLLSWLVCHLSTSKSLIQQRRPLPSLLFDSSSMGQTCRHGWRHASTFKLLRSCYLGSKIWWPPACSSCPWPGSPRGRCPGSQPWPPWQTWRWLEHKQS